MKRIYLDQRDWIGLMKASRGDRDSARFRDVLAVVEFASTNGLASFPLSSAHYIETYRRGDPISRRQLGSTMASISRFHAIAGPSRLLPAELDAALSARFGRPTRPQPAQVFGTGVHHAFNRPEVRLPDLSQLAEAGLAPSDVRAVVEHEVIAGPPFRLPAFGIGQPSPAGGESFASREQTLTQQFIEHGDPDLPRRQAIFTEVSDLIENYWRQFQDAGVDPRELADLGPDAVTEFIQSQPVRGLVCELRRRAHANPQFPWEANDLDDMIFLAIGAVHCDVVVGDKKWTDLIRRCKAPYKARVLSNLVDLPAALA
jgi:hypothetical protein